MTTVQRKGPEAGEKLDLAQVKADLAVMVIGITDPAKSVEAFGIVHGINDEAGLLEALKTLEASLSGNEAFIVLKGQLEQQILGGEFPEGSMKRTLVLAVVRSATRGRAMEQLRALSEDDVTVAINVVIAALESQIGTVLEGDFKEDALAPRNDQFRELADEVVSLRMAHPEDVRTKNLLVLLQRLGPEMATDELLLGMVARLKKEFGEIKEPAVVKIAEETGAQAVVTGARAEAEPAEPTASAAPAAPTMGAEATGGVEVDKDEDDVLSKGDIIKAIVTSKGQGIADRYRQAADADKKLIEDTVLEQFEKALKEQNALMFVYFYEFAKNIGLESRVSFTAADLRGIYVRMVTMKMDSRPVGRFVNCVARECYQLVEVAESDAAGLKEKWRPGNEDIPRPLNYKDGENLANNLGWIRKFHDSDEEINLKAALKKCGDVNKFVLAAVADFLFAKDRDSKLAAKVLKAVRSDSNTEGFDVTSRNIRTAFEKAVEVYISEPDVKPIDVQSLRAACVSNRGDEVYERVGRSLQKYTRVGKYCDLELEHIGTLERLEHEIGSPFVTVNAFSMIENMQPVVGRLLDEAIEAITQANSQPTMALNLQKKREVAEEFAKVFASFYNALGFQGRVRFSFFDTCRNRLGNPQEDEDRKSVNILGEAIALEMFPDFACSPDNERIFRMIIIGGDSNFRSALESLSSREAKLCFMALVNGDPAKSINLLIDVAGNSGQDADKDALREIFGILGAEKLIEANIVVTATKHNSCKFGKAESDWEALQNEEQEFVKELLKKLGAEV